MSTQTINQTVYEQVREAYADCWLPWSEGASRRSLQFRASESVSRDEAVMIMRSAVPDGYNDFTADLLLKLPEGCMVTLAREYSVCIHTNTPVSGIGMNADEVDNEGSGTRIWWD